MAKILIDKIEDESAIAMITSSENFIKLSKESQGKLLDTISESKTKEGGAMGKLFGTRPANASMNIALVICLILCVIGIFINQSQIWDKIITLIAATVGYIFGKGRE